MTYAKDELLFKKTAEEIVPELLDRLKLLDDRLDTLTNSLKMKDMLARRGKDPSSVSIK